MTEVTPPIKGERHLIESVSFRGQIVVCTCGVTTTIEGWAEHRGKLSTNHPRKPEHQVAAMAPSERWR